MAAELFEDVYPSGTKYLRHVDNSYLQTRKQLATQMDEHLSAYTIVPTEGGLLPLWVVGLTLVGGAVVIARTLSWMRT